MFACNQFNYSELDSAQKHIVYSLHCILLPIAKTNPMYILLLFYIMYDAYYVGFYGVHCDDYFVINSQV